MPLLWYHKEGPIYWRHIKEVVDLSLCGSFTCVLGFNGAFMLQFECDFRFLFLFFLGQILLVSSHWKHSAGNDRIYPAYLVPVWRDNCSRFAQILPGLIWSQLPPGFPLTSVPSGPDPGLSCTSPDRVSASIYFRVCGGTWLCCIFFFSMHSNHT